MERSFSNWKGLWIFAGALAVFPTLLSVGMFFETGFLYKFLVCMSATFYMMVSIAKTYVEARECSAILGTFNASVLLGFPLLVIFQGKGLVPFGIDSYDIAMHLAGGALAGVVVCEALSWIWYKQAHKTVGLPGFLVVTVAVALVGIGWEAFEWLVGAIGPHGDTLSDLVCDMSGAWIAWMVLYLSEK